MNYNETCFGNDKITFLNNVVYAFVVHKWGSNSTFEAFFAKIMPKSNLKHIRTILPCFKLLTTGWLMVQNYP